MGQIKNIKLHIVTDIKITNNNNINIMKFQLLFVFAAVLAVAYGDNCCHHPSGVFCMNGQCERVSEEEFVLSRRMPLENVRHHDHDAMCTESDGMRKGLHCSPIPTNPRVHHLFGRIVPTMHQVSSAW